MATMRFSLRPLVFVVLLPLLCSGVAHSKSPFDATKRAVLPSKAAAPLLERHDADGDWRASEWTISPKDLDRLEAVLAPALRTSDVGRSSFDTHAFYRQYMPVRWKTFHVIVVNGFNASASDLFPDRGISPDQWKHELMTVFGGGCGYWYTVYVVEQNRLMALPREGARRKSAVVCNAPK